MNNLKTHRIKIHKMGEEKFKCKQCPHTTNRRAELRSHIEAVHDNIRDHKCEVCEWAFSDKSKLRRHIKYVHNKDDNIRVKPDLTKREPSPIGSIY